MDEMHQRRSRTRVGVAQRLSLGRMLAVGVVVLWLVTLLLTAPASWRGLF